MELKRTHNYLITAAVITIYKISQRSLFSV